MRTKRLKSALLASSLSALAASIATTAPAPAAESATRLAQAARNPCGAAGPCAPGRVPASDLSTENPCSPGRGRARPVAAPRAEGSGDQLPGGPSPSPRAPAKP